MERVRAKFVVSSVVKRRDANGKVDGRPRVDETASVTLRPVYGGGDPSHENAKYWKATPSGVIELQVVNPAAVEALQPGQEFYVDFIPA